MKPTTQDLPHRTRHLIELVAANTPKRRGELRAEWHRRILMEVRRLESVTTEVRL